MIHSVICMTFDGVTKVRAMLLRIFQANSLFFIAHSYSTP